MTEQERFELPKSLLDLRSLLLHTKLSVIALSDAITLLDQVEIDWQAAQQKEGCVLVPVELTYKQALSVARSDFDAGANIFNHAHRHLSNDDKAEIKGRWIGSKAFTIQDQYMALIKAAQEAE